LTPDSTSFPHSAHALFVPGEPARFGRFALWGPGIEDGDTLDLFQAAEEFQGFGARVRKLPAPVRYLTIEQALAPLLADGGKSPSLTVWAAAARAGLDLIARGWLRPAVTDSGYGAWRIGPLAETDVGHLHALAAALPPEGYAQALPGAWPAVRVPEPATLILALWDALADTLPRRARPAESGPDAEVPAAPFAEHTPVKVRGPLGWLRPEHRARLVLRVVLPRVEPAAPGEEQQEPPVCKLEPWVRATADPSLLIKAETVWTAAPVVAARFGTDPEQAALLALRRAARIWPPLARALDLAVPGPIELPEPLLEALLDQLPLLSAADVEVLIPVELVGPALEPRAVAVPAQESAADAVFSLGQLLRLTWRPAEGGEPLTEAELEQLAAAKSSLVRLRGRWVRLDAATARRLRRARGTLLTGATALAAALEDGFDLDGEWYGFEATGDLIELKERLVDTNPAVTPVPVPPALNATLRPYQQRGLDWLAGMTRLGLGGCLADDMGLGKTIQVIALHLHRVDAGVSRGPTLVVCPTSLLGNWEQEIIRFAPGLPVRRYHGGARHLQNLAPDEIVLATYGLVRSDAPELARTAWGLIVADEAQYVKNPFARTSRQLRTLAAPARIALTGTPVENRLADLWALLDWTTPGLLGPLEDFHQQVAIPVERDGDADAAERLAKLASPFLLRRSKTDPQIAPELPAKTETDRLVPLTAEQASLYKAVLAHHLAEIEANPHLNRRFLILKMLTALKQVCNHPAQYLHEPGPLPGRSGKLDALDDILDVVLAEGESVLVFSQYVQMVRLIERHLADQNIKTLTMSGQTRNRDETVAKFQAGAAPVLLLSLKAGGVGLNLTRATHVVHYDRWWNPAVEDQASDRAHRIGQDRPVQIHRLVTEGTLEERIATLLVSKRALAASVIGGGDSWLTDLSTAQLAELVALGPDLGASP
jgi:superfamily II DNA or RNA helicase